MPQGVFAPSVATHTPQHVGGTTESKKRPAVRTESFVELDFLLHLIRVSKILLCELTNNDDRKNLTDEAIIGLAYRCLAITNIDVGWCENLTDEAITGLADHCPAITNIDVGWCEEADR